jgi:glycolate oxidase FAD binding subunit
LLTSTVSETDDRSAALTEIVRAASAEHRPLRIVGGDTKVFYGRKVAGAPLEVAGHRGVVEYEPSELVITARAGTPIVEIEALLARHNQIFAFEPPVLGPTSTLGGVVASGLSGPRRPYAGAVRDSVLGVTVLNGKGEILRFGGTVFKNVAGFDAFRLMSGALGCLGVILEVSVRVSPAPAAEASRSFDVEWPRARETVIDMMRRPTPLSGAAHDGHRLHLRLSGANEAVAATLGEIGGEQTPVTFWDDLRHRRLPLMNRPRLWRLSVPRTANLPELPGGWLRDWGGAEIWLDSEAEPSRIRRIAADAGGHATLYRGAKPEESVFAPLPEGLMALHRRVKAAFDPAGVFNPGRMYEGL